MAGNGRFFFVEMRKIAPKTASYLLVRFAQITNSEHLLLKLKLKKISRRKKETTKHLKKKQISS